MGELQIVETNIGHIRELRGNLREADYLELKRMGLNAKLALVLGYKRSIWCKTALVNGKVAAIWGINGAPLSITGIPWLLTSKYCELVSPIKFARIYKGEVRKMLELFPCLENMVDASYYKSVRMLELMGFRLGEPEEIGYNAMLRKFSIGTI